MDRDLDLSTSARRRRGLARMTATVLVGATLSSGPASSDWQEQVKLTAQEGQSGDQAGVAVAIFGDTAVVGAIRADPDDHANVGGVYVYTRSGDTWSQQARLAASDGVALDNFGNSVAISGDTVLVGAPDADPGGNFAQGAAYVFTRSGTVWSQQAKLTADDGQAVNLFGAAVALDGDSAIIGAPLNAVSQGAAYVFVRDGDVWSQQDKLTADDGEFTDQFGGSVALSGDTAVIGAPQADVDAADNAGASYVFTRSAGVWDQTTRISASDAALGDLFGDSVAVTGDTILVGAPSGGDGGGGNNPGAAYVFVRDGDAWSEQARLIASDAASGARFGDSVSLAGDTALVGVGGQPTLPNGDLLIRSAYVFIRSGDVWSEEVKLVGSDITTRDPFAFSVALDRFTALVGEPGGTVVPTNPGGTAYVFVNDEPSPGPATLQGTVRTLGRCSAGQAPLAGAMLEILGAEGTFTLETDDEGFYQIVLPESESPVDILVTAAKHLSATAEDVELVADETVIRDFDLILDAPCAATDPASLSFDLLQGQIDVRQLTIGNLGAAALEWSIDEAESSAGGGIETVADGGFEAGTPSPFWEEGSTNFGTPLCMAATCGVGNGSGPHGGAVWAWFGGIDQVDESGFVAQEIIVPMVSSGALRFFLEIPVADITGSLEVSMDGDVLFTASEQDAGDFATYAEVVVDVSAYTDGGVHDLRFTGSTVGGAADEISNFFVDDVSLTVVEGVPCDSPTDVVWLSVEPASGTTPPDASVTVDVMVDTSGLNAGSYAAQLCVTTNDPAASLVSVPVALTVTEPNPEESYIPMALAVDLEARVSDGNGVLEPGEQVEVSPSWRNDGESAQSLTGTASSFGGPAGAVYTLTEDDADYGLLEPGQAASCGETGVCYVMGLDDPAARPATHWEASFDERLDDGKATTKTWSLHIGDSFADVPRGNIFYRFIETLLHLGVTGGCTAAEYCPAGGNTRGQMAVFLLKAAEGADYVPAACVEGDELFADVPADGIFCPWIEELASRQITSGCGGGSYCPGDPVTRGQMAVFLLKAFEGEGYKPPECSGVFSDVPCPSTFAGWIEDLAARGVTGGCAADPPAYCPAAPVSRAQMAVFIVRTFGLALYGP